MMRYLISLITLTVMTINPVLAENNVDLENLIAFPLERLLKVNVISASKRSEEILEAPSAVTVVTATQIKRHGLRSVEEVLERVSGYFPTGQVAFSLMGSRGLIQDQNINYLFLLDGHALNSITVSGMHHQFVFPLISSVERIEIIRGPGSTLWGSDAAVGIIHIITKNGTMLTNNSDKDRHIRLNLDYSVEDEQHIANVVYGNQIGDTGDISLSYTNTASDSEWTDLYRSSSNGYQLNPNKVSTIRDLGDSHEFYGKLNLGDFSFLARYADLVNTSSQRTNRKETQLGDQTWKNFWFETKYNHDINEELTLHLRAFYDEIDYGTEHTKIPEGTRLISTIFGEQGAGVEASIDYNVSDSNTLTAGLSYRQIEVDPSRLRRGEPDGSESFRPLAAAGTDKTYSIYIDDRWQATENLSFVLGGRVDKNDFREESNQFLPRTALIYNLNPTWTTKYLFNTGYIRPPVAYINGAKGEAFFDGDYYQKGVDNSEKVQSHDLQLLHQSDTLSFTATVYQLVVKDYFTWVGKFYDATHRVTYQNINDVESQGIELEFRKNFTAKTALYGNYAHSTAETDSLLVNIPELSEPFSLAGTSIVTNEKELVGVPKNIWNLGIDTQFTDQFFVNLHYRGWSGAKTREINSTKGPNGETIPATYSKLSSSHAVDINFLYENVAGTDLSLSVYGKNIFDKQNTYVNAFNGGGYRVSSGWNAGIKIVLEL